MIYNKKGQAAMEFLMTYGWAILAAIVAIGVLAYFGVFSPGTYISDSVTVNAPFGTTQELSIQTGSIAFVLRNGGGSAADISSVAVAGCGTYSTAFTLADGASQLVTVTCSPVLTSGDKFKGALTITYRTGEKLLDLTGTGNVAGRVA
jgi:uncharacterized protein (UPF0333 family)